MRRLPTRFLHTGGLPTPTPMPRVPSTTTTTRLMLLRKVAPSMAVAPTTAATPGCRASAGGSTSRSSRDSSAPNAEPIRMQGLQGGKAELGSRGGLQYGVDGKPYADAWCSCEGQCTHTHAPSGHPFAASLT